VIDIKTIQTAAACLLLASLPPAFAQETIPGEMFPATEISLDLFARDSYRIDTVITSAASKTTPCWITRCKSG